jgi:hypothetical protein
LLLGAVITTNALSGNVAALVTLAAGETLLFPQYTTLGPGVGPQASAALTCNASLLGIAYSAVDLQVVTAIVLQPNGQQTSYSPANTTSQLFSLGAGVNTITTALCTYALMSDQDMAICNAAFTLSASATSGVWIYCNVILNAG